MRRSAVLMTWAMIHAGCAHSGNTAPRIHIISEKAEGIGPGSGTGGASDDFCQSELEQCMKVCWEKKQWPYPHSKEQAGWYYKRCTSDCNRQFLACEEEQEEAERQQTKRVEFARMNEALQWLREHKAEVALGTLVVVAGVVFIVTTSGAGALILAPLLMQ